MTATNATNDRELERIVALTRDLVLIPGTHDRIAERRRCYEFVKNHLEVLPGIQVREFVRNDYQSLVAHPSGHSEPEILICAHLDVIDHPEPDAYRSSIREGRIYGAGCGDMKGALAISLEVFRTVCSRNPDASLGLAITSDEETGGEHGIGYLFGNEGLRCGVALVPDGGSLGEVTVEEKGLLHLRLRQHGHAAHAARPWLGSNALEQLIDKLLALRSRFRAYQVDEGSWHPTCAITVLGTKNRTTNRIPAESEAVVDIRYPTPYTEQDIMNEVRSAVGEDAEVERIISGDPAHLKPDPDFIQVTEEITGEPVRLVRGDGASDARFICEHGIPVMMSRPIVGNLHAEDEWIDIASMDKYYQIYLTYICRKLAIRL
jgi:succinyl-diaminopimelate desuccinylase